MLSKRNWALILVSAAALTLGGCGTEVKSIDV